MTVMSRLTALILMEVIFVLATLDTREMDQIVQVHLLIL